MDRSSMRRVETTNDHAKRLAFKDKLAKRIVEAAVEEVQLLPHPDFFPVGSKIVEPQLGVCTVLSVDHKNNELVLDSERGPVSLVLSIAKSHLAPYKEAVRQTDDCFLGETIDRTQPKRAAHFTDVEQLDRQQGKHLPKKAVPQAPRPFAVGDKVTEPLLGLCTVVSVNYEKNELVLDSDRGQVSLVLSAAQLAPYKEPVRQVDDAFFGDTIDRSHPQQGVAFDVEQLDRQQGKYLPKKDAPVAETIVVGTQVTEPQLGVCTVVSIDTKGNEIVLDSERGQISLVLSVARSRLSPYKEAPARQADDCFIGGTINRDKVQPIAALDPDQLDFQQGKHLPMKDLPTPEAIVPGRKVWHPELGACTVVSMDRITNEIVLDSDHGQLSLVYSLVQPRLILTDQAPEHVPVRPPVREAKQKLLTPPEPRALSLALPGIFSSWSQASKHHYLAYNQHLTTEEINDVLAVLDGKQPLVHSVEIEWAEVTSLSSEELPQAPPRIIEVVPHELIGKRVWHPDFGECSVLSIDKSELILSTSLGHVPVLLDVTLPKLVPLADGQHIEHVPKKLKNIPTTKV